MYGSRYFGTRYYPARYYGGSSDAVPPTIDPNAPPYYTLYIDDIQRSPLNWEIDALINEQTSCRFDILSSEGTESQVSSVGRNYFSSHHFPSYHFGLRFFGGNINVPGTAAFYRPVADQTVKLYENNELIFGGLITLPRESGLGNDEATTQIRTNVNALDYKVLTQWRYVYETIPAGTLKATLTRVVSYLAGVTLSLDQVDGPLLPEQVYDLVRVEDVLHGLTTTTGFLWDVSYDGVLSMFLPGTVAAPYDVLSTNDVAKGDIEVEPVRDRYANRVIARADNLISIVNDEAEQLIKPIREVVISAPDTTDQAGLDYLAASYALTSVVIPKKIRFKTLKRGFAPGQTLYVQAPKRNLNNYFTILQVRSRRSDGLTWREITALEGSTYQADFARSTYRAWSGGGIVPVAGGGTGGASGSGGGRAVFPLAMSKTQAVRASTPGWIDAPSAIHVQWDTAVRGTSAIIKAQLRCVTVGNAVQWRLYNVSLDAPVSGSVGSVWTSTSWSPMLSTSVAMNSGAYVYKLQLLPNLINADVMAAGYME